MPFVECELHLSTNGRPIRAALVLSRRSIYFFLLSFRSVAVSFLASLISPEFYFLFFVRARIRTKLRPLAPLITRLYRRREVPVVFSSPPSARPSSRCARPELRHIRLTDSAADNAEEMREAVGGGRHTKRQN